MSIHVNNVLLHSTYCFRSEGSKLNNADEVTRGLWRKTFNVSFPRPGCMFRGNPPCGRLHPLTETYQMALLLPREIDVSIDKIQVSSLPLGNTFVLRPNNIRKRLIRLVLTDLQELQKQLI